MRRLALVLGAAPLLSCGSIVAGPDPAADAVAVFDAAWADIDRHYAFFSHFQIDWNDARARYRPQITDGADIPELWRTVCALVIEERSFHASLRSQLGTCSDTLPRTPDNYDDGFVTRALASPRRTTGHIQYSTLDADIGYVYVPSFNGEFYGEFERVLAALDGVQALVIDIRNNGGGNEANGRDIAGHFVTETRVYELARYRNGPGHDDFTTTVEKRFGPVAGRRFTGPVAVLMNRFNGSAAEDFVAMMETIPNAITVGDTTLGTSSNPLIRELPNGWVMRIPQSMQMTPDGTVIEGRGHRPLFPVQQDSADALRRVDTILETAKRELRSRF